jgi:hypothetical protein
MPAAGATGVAIFDGFARKCGETAVFCLLHFPLLAEFCNIKNSHAKIYERTI